MNRVTLTVLALLAVATAAAGPAAAAEPDYRLWQDLLAKHYDPARGMSYKGLKQDKTALDRLRQQMAAVDAASLSRPEQLAYWINLYNISTANVIVENYPVDSIRDLSTDPILRLNVFKKPSVKVKGGTMSLNDVENDRRSWTASAPETDPRRRRRSSDNRRHSADARSHPVSAVPAPATRVDTVATGAGARRQAEPLPDRCRQSPDRCRRIGDRCWRAPTAVGAPPTRGAGRLHASAECQQPSTSRPPQPRPCLHSSWVTQRFTSSRP